MTPNLPPLPCVPMSFASVQGDGSQTLPERVPLGGRVQSPRISPAFRETLFQKILVHSQVKHKLSNNKEHNLKKINARDGFFIYLFFFPLSPADRCALKRGITVSSLNQSFECDLITPLVFISFIFLLKQLSLLILHRKQIGFSIFPPRIRSDFPLFSHFSDKNTQV